MIAQESAELVSYEMWVNNSLKREVKSSPKGNLIPSSYHDLLFCIGKNACSLYGVFL